MNHIGHTVWFIWHFIQDQAIAFGLPGLFDL